MGEREHGVTVKREDGAGSVFFPFSF